MSAILFGGEFSEPRDDDEKAKLEEARVDALSRLPDDAFIEEMKECARLKKAGVDVTQRMMRLGKSQGPHIEKRISETLPGVTGILDRRRLAYGMLDGYFKSEAVYDRIFVFQTPRVVGDMFEDTMLYKPENTQQREEEENPCGVILSAGLKALDSLRSNGMDIGSLVEFARLSPTRKVVDVVRGQEVYALVLRVGDLIGSLDLPYYRREAKVVTRAFVTTNGIQHRLVDANAVVEDSLAPAMPWISQDL